MKVLIACEYSGIVRDAFIKRGHDAISCDLLPTESPGPHYQGDVMDIINDGFDLMVGHPPCTYLTKTSCPAMKKDPLRYLLMREAHLFFMKLYKCNIKKICIENPIPMKRAELPQYNQIIQPYYFGDKAWKTTCLWLKNLPILFSTMITSKGEMYITKEGKKKGAKWYCYGTGSQKMNNQNRSKIRSKTFPGIADAMAEQWGII